MENLTLRLREAYGRKDDLSRTVAEQNEVLREVNDTVKGLEREAKEVVYNYTKDNFELVGTIKSTLDMDIHRLFYDKTRKIGVELGEDADLYYKEWGHAVSLWQDVDEETFRDYTRNVKRKKICKNVYFCSVLTVVGIPVALTALFRFMHYSRKANEIRSSKKPHILRGREALFYLLEKYDIGKQQQCKKQG
ncbi:hypothetical protein HYU07_00775 [Candidatus Woesearchaeota archaeon]|nr:hypothetical protein [Candidatus Woesearchaeota archaeon]